MPNFKNRPNSCIKTENGLVWASRSLAVVTTVLLNYVDDTYALLLERGQSVHSPGKWCVPCGYLDWDETASQCAMREVWEETGLDLASIQNKEILYNGISRPWDINTNPNLNESQDIALHFSFIIKSDRFPTINNLNAEEDEVVDVRWVKLSDFDQYNFAFTHDERISRFLTYYKELNGSIK